MENVRQLLSSLGNPHTQFPSVHIAGTNGKGSTAAMIAAGLMASGYRTGLYTSPHLANFTERIRVNGKQIPEQELIYYTQLLKKEIEKTKATFFEATTAIAFQYFAEKAVEIAVIETGLGGRLDATNVVTPLVTVITSIGLEHTDILGNSLKTIAREKGCIMKQNVPCILGSIERQELEVLQRIAERRRCPLIYLPRLSSSTMRSHSLMGFTVDIQTPFTSYENIHCPLPGEFQIRNLAIALTTIDHLRFNGYTRLTTKSIRNGLERIRRLTGFRARLEVFSKNPLVILDVAHNADAIKALVYSLRKLCPRKMVLVFGVMKDKEIHGMVSELVNLSRITIAVAPETARALEPKNIATVFHSVRSKCVCAANVPQAADLAMKEARPGEATLITGSHYVVGDFLRRRGKSIDVKT